MTHKKLSSTVSLVAFLSASLIIMSKAHISSEQSTSTKSCPSWFLHDNKTGQCVCGDGLGGIVSCDSEERRVYIIQCYCMTHDNQTGIAVGSCFSNCVLVKKSVIVSLNFEMYYQVPLDPHDLNDAMCGDRWNRSGRFCGKCKDGYYPLVYSYDMKCINCTDANYNWLKFMVAAFVPLTFFFILVLSFGISATSPPLDVFVMFAQTIAIPANVRMVLEATNSKKYPLSQFLCRFLGTLYGIWNLDFFRTLLPQVCLKISTLQALALDYIIAFYPLVLIIITYILFDLYDRQFFLLKWAWKPFNVCFQSFGSINIIIKSSIIKVFGTFLLLSYVKLLSVSFDLLVFVKAYNTSGDIVGTYLYYDATIEYFGKEHLPYGIIAIVVTTVFIFLPLLFSVLHPLKCFKRYTGKWPALHICLDSFQGYFKDGTDGTHDCRCFSSLYLFTRIALFATYSFMKNTYFYPFASILLLFLAALVTVVQPFKQQFGVYNSIHVLLLLNLAAWFVTVQCIHISSVKAAYVEKFSSTLSVTIAILPLFYISFVVLKWVYSRKLVQRYYVKCCGSYLPRKGFKRWISRK